MALKSPDSTGIADAFHQRGYAIVRQLFSAREIAGVGRGMDQVYAEGLAHGRSFRHGNLFYNVGADPALGTVVRLAQWPSYHVPALNAVRLDRRMCALVAPLIGDSLKQIINQLHWKPPGAAQGDFAWHQDCRFRQPESAYRDLATSYVQVGLAVDPHTPASGGMKFVPGSHLRGDLHMEIAGAVMENRLSDNALLAAGLDPASVVTIDLEPGDVAVWSPFLVHGSGPNSAGHARRLYINGYVTAASCDRGEWAFRDGQPVPFGLEPALVHFEALHERPEPHYI
jgi:ectoine hydroxylase-related dioxygenase (phytanoyl-CoA dioxygenase family)